SSDLDSVVIVTRNMDNHNTNDELANAIIPANKLTLHFEIDEVICCRLFIRSRFCCDRYPKHGQSQY
ncbi:hypothetical protein, partial [Chryseobacterium sp. CH1]|uniref:hypothetical protein n=1 Tax=Chryseobacterium sp. CH1 TaxID=713551 RepID=UPI001E564A7E